MKESRNTLFLSFHYFINLDRNNNNKKNMLGKLSLALLMRELLKIKILVITYNEYNAFKFS